VIDVSRGDWAAASVIKQSSAGITKSPSRILIPEPTPRPTFGLCDGEPMIFPGDVRCRTDGERGHAVACGADRYNTM
jgi:hypothetical protein